MEPIGIFHLMLGVGNACNLTCRHCYREEAGALTGELTFDELTRAMVETAEVCADRGLTGLVTLSGGEPLMRPDLADLVRLARLVGLVPRVITNGTMLTAPRVRELQEAGIGLIQISLDGARPETHDAIRGQGRHAQAVRALRELVAAGVHCDIKVTLMPGHNDQEIAEFFALANELGVPKISFGRLVAIGHGQDLEGVSDPERYREWVEALITEAQRSPFTRLDLREPTYDRSYLLPDAAVVRELPQDVPLSIDSDGTVYPSRRLPVSLGNFRHGTIVGFLNHPLLAAMRAKRFSGRCGDCDLLEACRGGSRASAYGEFGDPLAEDPDCWYRP